MSEIIKSAEELLRLKAYKQKKIEIVYVDPNTDLEFYGGTNDYLKSEFKPGRGNAGKLMIPPEDLAIYVNLRVEPVSTTKWGGDKKNIEVTTVMYHAASVPSASADYVNAKVRYLTTDYLDYGWETATMDHGYGQPEALGIKNINIEYKSWFTPTVTITFIDIMGLATFSPLQKQMEISEDGNISAVKSLFKAFYAIPYPRFTLTVKGYFGSPVTYYLQCTNVSSQINTTTGNVEITVPFQGYRWGKYTDVPAKCVFMSPYLKAPVDMSVRWEQKYQHTPSISSSNSDFTGTIPDLFTLRKMINETIKSIKALPATNNLATCKQEFKDFYETEEALLKSIKILTDKINENENPFNVLINNDVIATITTKDNFEAENNNPKNIVFTADGWITTAHDSKYSDICKSLKDIISNSLNNYNEEITKLINSGWDKLSSLCTQIEFKPYYLEEEDKKTTKIIYEIGLVRKTISENKKNINKEVIEREAALKRILYDQALDIVNEMPFVPTMFNIMKFLFAHYLHFIESFVSVSTVGNDSNGKNELRESIKENYGEYNEKSIIHPWFLLREYDPKKGHITTHPYHEEYNNLPEIQYTNAVHLAITDVRKQLAVEKAEEEAKRRNSKENNVEMDKYKWKPLFAYDISYRFLHTAITEINPYKIILKNYELMDAIVNIGVLATTRMFASIGTRYNYDSIKNKVPIYAEADAKNIFDAIKSETKLCESIKNYLQTGDFDTLLLLLVSSKEDDWGEIGSKYLYNNISNINNKLLLSNDITDVYDKKFRCADKVTVDNKEVFQLRSWRVVYNNTRFPMLPLCALTFSDMKEKWLEGKVWGKEHPQLFSGSKESLKILYPSVDINIVKASFNIVDLIPDTIKNLNELYNQYNKDNIVDTWFNVDGNISSTDSVSISHCFIDEEYIINKNIDPGKNELSLSFIKEKNTVNSITQQTENYLTIVGTTSSPINSNKELIESLSKIKSTTIPIKQETLINKKNDCMKLRDFVQRLRNGEIQNECIAIPHLNTIEKKKGIFFTTYNVHGDTLSIFAYSSYYGINDEDKEENRNYYKAFLLLQSLGVNIIQLDKITDESKYHQSTLIRLPKILVLNIGSILYMKEYYKEKSKSLLLDEAFENIKDKTEKIGNLSEDIKIVFIDYFKNWANWANGKNGIIRELEYGTFKSDNFSVSYDKRTLKKPLSTTDKRTSFPAYNKGVSVITSSNKYGHVQLFLDPTNKSVQQLMNLYVDDVLILNSRYGISNEKRDSYIRISSDNIKAYIKTLNEKLLELLGGREEIKIEDLDETTITVQKNVLMEGYYRSFKKLHDTWYLDKDINSLDYIEQNLNNMINKMMIVDNYFSDIKDDLFVNLNIVNNLLEKTFDESTNFTFLDVLSRITQDSDSLMLPMPTLGFFSGADQNNQKDFLNYLFKPQIYSEIKPNPEEDFGVIIMRIAKPSETPTTDPYDSEESDYENTALQLTYDENMRRVNKGKELMGNGKNNAPLRAFGVSFGRENESFFNIKNLSTTNPSVTAQSIAMALNLVKKANEDSQTKTYIGEDLYSAYSKNAYSADVEIRGGSAAIFPLMYFQLNNVFLFTGGYIITQVNHNISENYMTTTFKGIKQDFHKQPSVEIPFINALIGEIIPTEQTLIEGSSSSSSLSDEQRKQLTHKRTEFDPNYKIVNVLLAPGHWEKAPAEGSGKETPEWDDIKTFFGRLNPKYMRYYNESFLSQKNEAPKRFREFAYNRLICRLIQDKLEGTGINVKYFPGKPEGGYTQRYNEANKYKANDTLLLIIHGNAGPGTWSTATGWEIYTKIGDGQSAKYGEMFCGVANMLLGKDFPVRNPQPKEGKDGKKNENLIEFEKTTIPTVLTENLFYNNRTKDLPFLISNTGIETIVNIHVEAIKMICGIS